MTRNRRRRDTKSGRSEEEFRKREWRVGRRKGGKIPTIGGGKRDDQTGRMVKSGPRSNKKHVHKAA